MTGVYGPFPYNPSVNRGMHNSAIVHSFLLLLFISRHYLTNERRSITITTDRCIRWVPAKSLLLPYRAIRTPEPTRITTVRVLSQERH